ncbi:GntR family transcriptional regulator [Oceanobacillus sp. J11TS1]|uniref:GntR family transcriptional regulator n=1 Tax=Oceanobacillus sp. J11TS1 TaxID=2807191 RepID=UPI001B2CD8B8|nr:GntR family transcriptional regulator [Oceanobacillus sp. J11TS1]GIO23597.1 putative HTH-type transcriptional regulator YydK [Oceanobacillus sp. J11TS1]
MLKYQQIAIEIESYIEKHQMQQGEKLPVLESLMKEFKTSKSTIVKALDLLEKKGIIFQVRGSGIFVRRKKRNNYINLLSNQGFQKDLDQFNITSEMLELEIQKPTETVAQNLHVDMDQDIYYVKRIRYIEGNTLCLEESFFNKAIVPYLNNEIGTSSIFRYIEDALSLKIGFSDMYMHVGKLIDQEASYLQLKGGDPKLTMESIFYLTNGTPFDYSKVTYNYNQAQFYILGTGI